jgi:NAD(P)H-nitrite reductase large subunit
VSNLDDEDDDSSSGLVCDCLKVDPRRIEHAVRVLDLKTVDGVMLQTGAGGGCHSCWPVIEGILERCARGEFRFPLSVEEAAQVRRDAHGRTHSSLLSELKPRSPANGEGET